MSAKIPTEIVFAVFPEPFSLKKLETIFITPNFDTPFLGAVFTLRRKKNTVVIQTMCTLKFYKNSIFF